MDAAEDAEDNQYIDDFGGPFVYFSARLCKKLRGFPNCDCGIYASSLSKLGLNPSATVFEPRLPRTKAVKLLEEIRAFLAETPGRDRESWRELEDKNAPPERSHHDATQQTDPETETEYVRRERVWRRP